MGLRVRDVMQTEVRAVSPDMSLKQLEAFLLRAGISGAPVLDGGKVVGIVSRSDIVKHLQVEQSQAEALSAFYLEPFDAERASAEDRERVSGAIAARRQETTVGDVMSCDLLRVGPEESLETVAELMLERRVHRVLVMRESELLGLVSSLDLIRLFADARVTALP